MILDILLGVPVVCFVCHNVFNSRWKYREPAALIVHVGYCVYIGISYTV